MIAIYIPGFSEERDAEIARQIPSAETMNLAERAMNQMAATPCGPGDLACDGGIPAYHCPNHGGEPEERNEP